MVNPEEFKNKIKVILSQDYKIEFLGQNFEQIVNRLTDTKAEKIYEWIKAIMDKQIRPILVGSKEKYKDWEINQLLTFRYPFNVDAVEYRILLVKVKNSFYIEFHLGDHKYYDKVRKDLDLKRSGY